MAWRANVLYVSNTDTVARFLLLPQALHLVSLGYRVTIASCPGTHLDAVRAAGVAVLEVPLDRAVFSARNVAAVNLLARDISASRYDVVHVHTPIGALLGRVAAAMARPRPRLVFYTAHGFYFHEHAPAVSKRLHILLEQALGRVTDHLFCQSAEDARVAVAYGIAPETRLTLLGNGVDVEALAGQCGRWRAGARAELGIPQEAVVVASTARVVVEKGFRELADAVSLLADRWPTLHVLIIGGSLPSDRKPFDREMRVKFRERGLIDRLHVTGFTSEVPRYLDAADIFTLPSHREGMPRTILEAMAMAKPVVATHIRGCREEVVAGGTGLLVPVRDSGSLANALEFLLLDPTLARRMGQAGLARARLRFDERLVFDRLATVYGRYFRQAERVLDGQARAD